MYDFVVDLYDIAAHIQIIASTPTQQAKQMITGRDAQPDILSKTEQDRRRALLVGQLHTMNNEMRLANIAMEPLSQNTPDYAIWADYFETCSEKADECIALLDELNGENRVADALAGVAAE